MGLKDLNPGTSGARRETKIRIVPALLLLGIALGPGCCTPVLAEKARMGRRGQGKGKGKEGPSIRRGQERPRAQIASTKRNSRRPLPAGPRQDKQQRRHAPGRQRNGAWGAAAAGKSVVYDVPPALVVRIACRRPATNTCASPPTSEIAVGKQDLGDAITDLGRR